MSRKQKAIVALGLAVAFALGVLVSVHFGRRKTFAPAGREEYQRGATSPCVDFREATSRLGQNACVSGRVLRVFTAHSGSTFLDFCADYRKCPFGSVIFQSDRSKFGDLQTLEGQRVELRGFLKEYQGRAEIVLSDAGQIRVIP